MVDDMYTDYGQFLEYFQEQYNVHDVYIRLTRAPQGYLAWAANRTMLETCLSQAGIKGSVDYNAMPHYPIDWFDPGQGETALEAAKSAVDAYHRAWSDPEKRTLMNAGCIAIAETLLHS